VRRFALVGAKLLPSDIENPLLIFLRNDFYYCTLLPMTLVVTFVAVYLNWLSMKFFRHN
jgi:hypothetical protein